MRRTTAPPRVYKSINDTSNDPAVLLGSSFVAVWILIFFRLFEYVYKGLTVK